MATSVTYDPLSLLREIEQRSLRLARGLPLQVEAKPLWSGIGFRLANLRLVVAMEETQEILTYPALSRIPGTRPWVKGIANVRSSLLPVMDLKGCLGKGATEITAESRVLAVHHNDIYAGLLVDEVLGLRHFFIEEDRVQAVPHVEAALNPYLQGAFLRDGQYWGVLSLKALVTSSLFMTVT
jgi:twitching motility protein PilI